MATNIAALPWYSFPATRAGLDAVWKETRSTLVGNGIGPLPAALSHSIPYAELFSNPHLVLSQCCGLDLYRSQTSNVMPLAVPHISALDVPEGYYFSYIVTQKAANLDRPRIIINNRSSHSGHMAIRSWLTANGYNDFTLSESGSHAQSLLALKAGRADLAAIDALSWQHLDAEGLIILDQSEPAPAPPFIVGKQSTVPAEDLVAALDLAFARFGQTLGIGGVLPFHPERYVRMVESASRQGILSGDRKTM